MEKKRQRFEDLKIFTPVGGKIPLTFQRFLKGSNSLKLEIKIQDFAILLGIFNIYFIFSDEVTRIFLNRLPLGYDRNCLEIKCSTTENWQKLKARTFVSFSKIYKRVLTEVLTLDLG